MGSRCSISKWIADAKPLDGSQMQKKTVTKKPDDPTNFSTELLKKIPSRQIDRQSDKRTDRQTDRQTVRRTDRQRKKETEL